VTLCSLGFARNRAISENATLLYQALCTRSDVSTVRSVISATSPSSPTVRAPPLTSGVSAPGSPKADRRPAVRTRSPLVEGGEFDDLSSGESMKQ
jgi:hypothetical protein